MERDRGPHPDEPYGTVANVVTLVRTVLALALGCAAATGGAAAGGLLLAGYLVYWVGDVADGWLARRLGQCTRRGAVLDILCDRACTVVLAVVFLTRHPGMALPIGIFLVQFAVVDVMLSLVFHPLGLLSPNDVHLVDRPLWRLNWSPPAKALNTAGVVVAVVAGSVPAATAIAVAVLALKVACCPRAVRTLRGGASPVPARPAAGQRTAG